MPLPAGGIRTIPSASRLLLRRPPEQQLAAASDLLTVEQIARFPGYTPHTVSLWCTEGRLRTMQRRPRFMVPKTWLLDYLIWDDYNKITRKIGKYYGMIQEFRSVIFLLQKAESRTFAPRPPKREVITLFIPVLRHTQRWQGMAGSSSAPRQVFSPRTQASSTHRYLMRLRRPQA